MLPSSVRILVCTEPQDMRRSFDRLAEVARTVMAILRDRSYRLAMGFVPASGGHPSRDSETGNP